MEYSFNLDESDIDILKQCQHEIFIIRGENKKLHARLRDLKNQGLVYVWRRVPRTKYWVGGTGYTLTGLGDEYLHMLYRSEQTGKDGK